MADATPTPTAPEGLTLAWVAVADLKGTLRADWINRSGGAYASYARVDVRLRNKAAPSTTTRTVRTFQPFTGITRLDITGLDTRVSWEVEIVASAGGKTASSGWKSADPLVTPKPKITGVERVSEADAWVYFTAPTSGLTRPTSAHVARSSATSDAGSSTPLNNVTLPATRVRLPIPAGTGAYRAWLSYHGPAGWSAKDVANVPAWWSRPAAPTNLAASRSSSDRSQVALSWQHAGTGGEAAESYHIEYSDDGQVWRTAATTTSRSATVTLGLSSGRTYGVTAINKAGRSSRTTVKVEPWWERVPGAAGLTSSRSVPWGQIRLGWSVPSTGARNPLRSILIRRKPVSGGDYKTVDTLPATARAWTDATTTHTSQWEYEVVTVGDLGWATTRPSVKVGVGMVPPDAPTGITVTRDADNPDQLHVAFTPRSTDSAPTTEVMLKARDEQGRISNAGEWVRLSSLTINTLTHNAGPNKVLSYAVEARNAAGTSSTLTWSEPWATTPLGATRFTATRQGANITLAWSAGATTADTWQIERSPDGGTNRYPLPDVAGDQRSTVMSGASYAVAHDFWIRPVRDGVAGEWVRAAATIPAGAPPQAPELLTSGWWPVGEPVTIQWRHVSADGSEQAQARIEYEVRGLSGSIVGLTSVPVSGSAQTTDLPEMQSVAHSTRWRAQTRSVGSSVWSPWSGWETVQAAERPTLTLEVPTTITSQAIRGRIIPPGAWISAEVSLLDADGRVVDVRTLRYPEASFVFDRGIRDRQAYTVTAVLHDGRLPSVEQTVEVTVEWERPPAPHLTATPEGETVRLDVSVAYGLRIIARNHAPDLGAIPSAQSMMSRVTGKLADTPEAGHFAGQSRTMWVLGPSLSFTRDDLGGATHWGVWLYNPTQADANVTVWQDATPNSYVIPPATEGLLFGEVPPSGLVEISTDRGLWVTRSYGAVLEPGESWDGETGWFDPDSVPDPGVVQGWLPDGSIYRAMEAASVAEADLPAPQAIRVELIRVTDGIEHSLGDAQEGVGYDLWPRFCAPEQYIARAWAENGAWQDSPPVEATVHQRDVVVNFGPGLAGRISGGPRTLTITGGTIEKAIRSYVGRDYPAQYDGDTRTPRVATLDLTLWKHHAPLREWEAAHNAGGLVLLRDASGEVIHGQLVTGTRTPDHHLHRTVQITVTETADRP